MTQTKPTLPPPVAIGGLGGSGTRVFAAMLQYAGYHIGDTLNGPLDNLWFTVLFKQAAWTRAQPDPAAIDTAVRIFRRAMTMGLAHDLSVEDAALIASLRADLPPEGPWHCGAQALHADALIASGPSNGPWGWKEPNTHIFLPQLNRGIADLRYIHVVRNGLDMAFSANTWQARHWGHLYGLPNTPDVPLPVHQLRFWTAANRATLDYGARHMPGRFLVMHYEDVCARPEPNWQRLRRFLDLPDNLTLPEEMLRPTTIGRSLDHDLSVFPEDLIKASGIVQFDVEKLNALGALPSL